MEKTLLLRSIIDCISLSGEGVKVFYDCENGIEVKVGDTSNVKYYNSLLSRGISIRGNFKDSCINNCLDSFDKFLSKYSDNILLIKEGIDMRTGNIVYVRVEAIKNNLDCLLLRLCREFDSISSNLGASGDDLGEFIYEGNSSYIDIFSLNLNIDGDEDKTIVRVKGGKILCGDLYDKVPSFKTCFNDGLLRCIWSLIGDFTVEVNMVNSCGVRYPFMYSLYIGGGLKYD